MQSASCKKPFLTCVGKGFHRQLRVQFSETSASDHFAMYGRVAMGRARSFRLMSWVSVP